MNRVKFRRHLMTCKIAEDDQEGNHDEGERTDEEIIIFSARTDIEPTLKAEETIKTEIEQAHVNDSDVIESILDDLVSRIEESECSRQSNRRKRSAQELCSLWDIDTSNIISKKRVVSPSLSATQLQPAIQRASRSGVVASHSNTSVIVLDSSRSDESVSESMGKTRMSARLRRGGGGGGQEDKTPVKMETNVSENLSTGKTVKSEQEGKY